jgi:LysM repeat protein
MKSRVVALAFGALAVLGVGACSSAGGTGAAPATTIKIGTPNYVTLLPQVTSTLPAPTIPGQQPGIVPGEQTYTVKGGDVMVNIAKKFCKTAQDLVDYNAWEDTGGFAHSLFPGDIVKIPPGSCSPVTGTTDPATLGDVGGTPGATSTTFDPNLGGTYVVQPGDYLNAIATKTGTTVDGIVAANGWPDGSLHVLQPGQKIRLPAKEG